MYRSGMRRSSSTSAGQDIVVMKYNSIFLNNAKQLSSSSLPVAGITIFQKELPGQE